MAANFCKTSYLLENGKLQSYAFPGGYPLYYVTDDGGVLCPDCANENIGLTDDPNDPQWFIIGATINYEDGCLFCNHCHKRIESAYLDEDDDA